MPLTADPQRLLDAAIEALCPLPLKNPSQRRIKELKCLEERSEND